MTVCGINTTVQNKRLHKSPYSYPTVNDSIYLLFHRAINPGFHNDLKIWLYKNTPLN